MEIRATTEDPPVTGADTIVVGIFDGKGIPHDVEDGALGVLVESGEARSGFRKLAVAHAAGRRWLLVGLGRREEFDAERARIAAAVALGRAREVGTRTLCWELPHHVGDEAIVAQAQNAARDLQNTPANGLTPQALARRAGELPGVEVEVHGRDVLE